MLQKNKWGVFSVEFGLRSPRRSENISHEKCHLYRRMRQHLTFEGVRLRNGRGGIPPQFNYRVGATRTSDFCTSLKKITLKALFFLRSVAFHSITRPYRIVRTARSLTSANEQGGITSASDPVSHCIRRPQT